VSDGQTPIKVFLLDDHEIVRRGVLRLPHHRDPRIALEHVGDAAPDDLVVVEEEDPDRRLSVAHPCAPVRGRTRVPAG